MPYNGSGTYTAPPGTTAVPDTVIESVVYNALVADLEVALSLAFPRDGQATMTGPLKTHSGGIVVGADTSITHISGGLTANTGINQRFFGENHATQANDWEMRTGSTVRLWWDHDNTAFRMNDHALVDCHTTVKAYTRFDGTAGSITPLANGSYNVASITDNGVGDYTINFTSAISTSQYAVFGTAEETAGNLACVSIAAAAATLTTAVRVVVKNGADIQIDSDAVSVAVYAST